MTAELITLIVGILISIALEIVPGLKEEWSDWKWKPLTMLVISVGTGLGMWALVCLAGIDLKMLLDCTKQGIASALYFAFVSFVGNQTTYAVGTHKTANARARDLKPSGCS